MFIGMMVYSIMDNLILLKELVLVFGIMDNLMVEILLEILYGNMVYLTVVNFYLLIEIALLIQHNQLITLGRVVYLMEDYLVLNQHGIMASLMVDYLMVLFGIMVYLVVEILLEVGKIY